MCDNHNRANYVKKINLNPGKNNIRLVIDDIKQLININSVQKIIHLSFSKKGQVFYIDNMRLELWKKYSVYYW